ncbi:MAG: sulfurtransferase [Euryarchaeota archaeon]|nr:sulfurtransferase [Euryarchaeota archaeon]
MKKFENLMSIKNEIENISASQAKEKINDANVQFIDVRDKESFEKGTIGNAIHLDKAFLEFYLAEGSPLENKYFKENLNKEKEYVVFCGVGGQGALSTKTMKDMDIKNVKNITGDMVEWEKLKK